MRENGEALGEIDHAIRPNVLGAPAPAPVSAADTERATWLR